MEDLRKRTRKQRSKKSFAVRIDETANFWTSYNIAPTQKVGAIRVIDGISEYAEMKWGLIPSWSKDISFASKLITFGV